MDTKKPEFKATFTPGVAKFENKPVMEHKKTIEDHIQDIKNLTFKMGGKVKSEMRFESSGKVSDIELTLSFKVH